jgi:hypothetical protein
MSCSPVRRPLTNYVSRERPQIRHWRGCAGLSVSPNMFLQQTDPEDLPSQGYFSIRYEKLVCIPFVCDVAFGMHQVGSFWWISWETTEWEVSVDTDSIRMPTERSVPNWTATLIMDVFFIFFLLLFKLSFYRPLVCYTGTNFYKSATFLNISNDVIVIVLFVFNFCDRVTYYDLFNNAWNSPVYRDYCWMIGWLTL